MLNHLHRSPFVALTLVVIAGCGSSIPTGPTAAGPGVTTPAATPQAWSGAAVLGRAGETSGKTESQTRFHSHDLIELRVDVGGIAPNVEVRTTWLGSKGDILGGEMHRSRAGQQTMVFASPSPGGLEPGNYRVQLRVAGQLVRELGFAVEPAAPNALIPPSTSPRPPGRRYAASA